jgi:hypothetical protein
MELNEALRDFQVRYEKTFIWVVPPDSTEESLFHVDKITPDDAKIANLTLSSPEFGRIVLNMGTAHTLKFKYPPVGVFQSGTDAQIFRRIPQRQYKRGLCAGNSAFYPVYVNMMRSNKFPEVLPHALVADAFAATQFSFKDAMCMLRSGRHRSVALQKNFSLMLPMSMEKTYTLMYWETPIAYINQDTGDVHHVIEAAFTKIIEQVKGR